MEPAKIAAYKRLMTSTIRVGLDFSNNLRGKEVQVSYLPMAKRKKISEGFYLGLPETSIDSNSSRSSLDETFELVEVTV